MREERYRYLFPFEKVPMGARILIYGAGTLGQEYWKQIRITGYCKLVGFVDRNHADYPVMEVPVLPPERVQELDFDYVVIALRTRNWLSEVERILAAQGVDEGCMVCVLERESIPAPGLAASATGHGDGGALAFESMPMSLAVLMSGGIGDMVIQKRFLMELMELEPDLGIDIYAVQNEAFPRWLYSDCRQVRNVMLDLGMRYGTNHERYSAAVSIYGSAFLQVDQLRESDFRGSSRDFAQRISRLRERSREEGLSLSLPDGVAFHRRTYRGEDCYSWYGYGGVFPMKGREVPLPASGDCWARFRHLALGRYITVNTGNGSCKDGKRIAKSWPVERFDEVLAMVRQRYPDLSIAQVGVEGEALLCHADHHLMGMDYGMLSCILKGALFHLDIEGGLVHLATQAGTTCIVLFGPTVMEYFAYEKNVNIRVGNCHGCAGLYRDINQCARHMAEPECMYSITPEIVMAEVERYMDGLERDGADGCI